MSEEPQTSDKVLFSLKDWDEERAKWAALPGAQRFIAELRSTAKYHRSLAIKACAPDYLGGRRDTSVAEVSAANALDLVADGLEQAARR